MTLTDALTRARRGAAWLDEHEPDWRGKVNPETLDMASGCNCIGGQLEYPRTQRFFWKWVERHGLTESELIALGFELTDEEFLEDAFSQEDALTQAWRQVLSEGKA